MIYGHCPFDAVLYSEWFGTSPDLLRWNVSQASEVLFGTVQTPHSPNEGVLKLGATWFAVVNLASINPSDSSFYVKLRHLTPYSSV